MIRTLNSGLGMNALHPDVLERSFDRCWPELETVIGRLSTTIVASASLLRSTEETLEHVLGEMRRLREQNERLLYLASQNEQLLTTVRDRTPGANTVQNASVMAHEAQDDLVRAARERLCAAAFTMHPELLRLIDRATLILGSDGLYEMTVKDADTFYQLRDPIDQIARQAGLGWGIHLRCEQLERERQEREGATRDKSNA